MDSFRSAVFARLNGDVPLTTLLATTTSIYHRRAPNEAAFPYIIFQKTSGTYLRMFGGQPLADNVWMFKAVDRAPSASKAEDVDARMDVVLSNAPLTLSAGSLMYLNRESDIDYQEGSDPDNIVHHVGGQYRVVIDKT